MTRKLARMILAIVTTILAWTAHADNVLIVASTTSTEQSGLFSYLLPVFQKTSGIRTSVEIGRAHV